MSVLVWGVAFLEVIFRTVDAVGPYHHFYPIIRFGHFLACLGIIFLPERIEAQTNMLSVYYN